MISVNGLGLRYGDKILFKDVDLTFTEGNC